MTHRAEVEISPFLKPNRWRLTLKLLFKITSRRQANCIRWRFSFLKLPVVCLIEHYAEGFGDTSIAACIYCMTIKSGSIMLWAARFMENRRALKKIFEKSNHCSRHSIKIRKERKNNSWADKIALK